MENIEYKTDSFGTEHILIHHADGGITTMLKSTYDAMQTEVNNDPR